MTIIKFVGLRKIKYENGEFFGYEPYFKKFVKIASVLTIDGKKSISHAHGYFSPHPYGMAVKRYCKTHNLLNS